MLLKNEPSGASTLVARAASLAVPALLAVAAIALGTRTGGTASDDEDERAGTSAGDGELHRFLVPNDTPDAPTSGLPVLELAVPDASARVLQEVHDRALETGLIIQDDGDVVPGEVRFDGERYDAELRIKGDWLDHVKGDQWSLRIKLDRPGVLGMRVFSIQAPSTSGYVWEWVVHQALRREGVLAPRSTFVDVVINGNGAGVYFLQEHFAKELLESQGRREGPIVRFDEGLHWDLLLQNGLAAPEVPMSARSGIVVDTAPALAYGEKRLSSIDGLARTLEDALEKMDALRSLSIASRSSAERVRRLDAMDRLEDETLDAILNVDRLACAHAVASLFQVEHSLFWHNMRFYHDPVLQRLEPVMFDNAAEQASNPDPVPLREQGFVARFASWDAYYEGVFAHLGRMIAPGYVEELLASLAPELARFAPSMPPGVVGQIEPRLLGERDYLRRVALPVRDAAFSARYELDAAGGESREASATLEVRAWAVTGAPVAVDGFRFANGGFVAAARALVRDDASTPVSIEPGGAVILAHDGRESVFRFAMDDRLAGLESVEAIKRAIRAASSASPASASTGPLRIDVAVVHRPLADAAAARDRSLARTTPLVFRRHDPAWNATGERPRAPSVADALARHPFLRFDDVSGELVVPAGEHDVDGDLVVPSATTLRAAPGATLRFDAGAALVTDAPLVFEGTEARPVVLEPKADAWGGIAVLGASGRSRWSGVVVRATAGIERGGWNLTGGVTFYRSPVDFAACRFEGTSAEDALNVFSADLVLADSTITGAASDSFDGDFVSGRIERCVFQDGGADGVDLSGSDVVVESCRFERLGDKAVSVGEATRAVVRGGLAREVSIGVASKDGSEVVVDGLGLEAIGAFALAVYVKKPAFGPARLDATRLRGDVEGAPADGGDDAASAFVVQTGCRLTIDGKAVATRDLDVERLYAEGVLGR